MELSGSVVTDEARKSLRDVSKTPVPDLSGPGEGPALDPDTQAFLDAHGGHGFAGAEGYVSDWPSAAGWYVKARPGLRSDGPGAV